MLFVQVYLCLQDKTAAICLEGKSIGILLTHYKRQNKHF